MRVMQSVYEKPKHTHFVNTRGSMNLKYIRMFHTHTKQCIPKRGGRRKMYKTYTVYNINAKKG